MVNLVTSASPCSRGAYAMHEKVIIAMAFWTSCPGSGRVVPQPSDGPCGLPRSNARDLATRPTKSNKFDGPCFMPKVHGGNRKWDGPGSLTQTESGPVQPSSVARSLAGKRLSCSEDYIREPRGGSAKANGGKKTPPGITRLLSRTLSIIWITSQ